jgi:cobalamin biosynthesis protein CobD/CbiB
VDDILEYITARITSALNVIAPEREIRVKKGQTFTSRRRRCRR